MQQHSFGQLYKVLVLSVLLSLVACRDEAPIPERAPQSTQQAGKPDDVIASVGDEWITFSQLNTMLNSSALLGRSIPVPGTHKHKQLMNTLLHKAISANLIYLDAKNKGIDRLTSYTEDVHRFEDAILASLYKSNVMIGEIHVSETEVLHFYNTQVSNTTELTDDVKLMIASMIRQKKLDHTKTTLRERLRKNVEVVVNEKVLFSAYDNRRSDADVVASYDSHRITWSRVKDLMKSDDPVAKRTGFYTDNDQDRRTRLEEYIDNAILSLKGRLAGLENDSGFIRRTAEYRKTRLINEHRNGLIHSWNPSQAEMERYFADNRASIAEPEMRQVQMVVVQTKEQAEAIKTKIDDGMITMSQAVYDYSIDPNAEQTLGDMGWVRQGTGYAGLDEFAFKLEPEIVSDPVESPAGWHLVRVLDVTEARFENLADQQTRQRTFRAYMQDRINQYVADLQENQYEVVVYDGALQRALQNQTGLAADQYQKEGQLEAITE